jgi:hypothetical protein
MTPSEEFLQRYTQIEREADALALCNPAWTNGLQGMGSTD